MENLYCCFGSIHKVIRSLQKREKSRRFCCKFCAAMNKNITRGSKKQKIHYTLRRLFPTYEEMCNMYPKAAKGRYTYPWFCILRIWKNGIMRHKIISRELHTIQQMDAAKIEKLNELYKKTGMPERK